MATLPRLLSKPGFEESEQRDAFEIIRIRYYGIHHGDEASDADVNLQEGDGLPDDATFIIMKANRVQAPSGYSRAIKVIARKVQPWS